MKKYIVKEDFYDSQIYKKKYTKGQVLYPDSNIREYVIKLFDNNGEFICDVDSPTYNEHIECIDQDTTSNINYQYGCNYYATGISTLYANKNKDKSKKLVHSLFLPQFNEERISLYDKYTNFYKCELSQLNNIIQNFVPITKEELLEWNKTRKETVDKLNKILTQIESFAYWYNMTKE